MLYLLYFLECLNIFRIAVNIETLGANIYNSDFSLLLKMLMGLHSLGQQLAGLPTAGLFSMGPMSSGPPLFSQDHVLLY